MELVESKKHGANRKTRQGESIKNMKQGENQKNGAREKIIKKVTRGEHTCKG